MRQCADLPRSAFKPHRRSGTASRPLERDITKPQVPGLPIVRPPQCPTCPLVSASASADRLAQHKAWFARPAVLSDEARSGRAINPAIKQW